MEQLLSHPDGVRLLHDRGRRFDLRVHEQSLVGLFSVRWSYVGAQGQEVSISSAHLTLSDLVRNRRNNAVTLEYSPYAGAVVGVRFLIRPDGIEVRPYLRRYPKDHDTSITVHHVALEGEDYRASFLQGFGRDPGWRFFPLGYNSFTPVWSRDSREVQKRPPFPTAEIFNQHYDSAYWGNKEAISTPWMATIQRSGIVSTLLLGFLEARVSLGEVALLRGDPPRVVLRADFGSKTLTGDELYSDPLLIVFSQDGDGLIRHWTAEVAERMGARHHHDAVPSGWCSWYHYYTRVKEEDIYRNLEALAELRERLPVRYVQLDDGYQTRIGDWLSTNRKFLGGLKTLAARVKDQGFLPGIWTAPFFVQRESVVFRHHRDWLLHDENGKPLWMGYLPTWGLLHGHVYGLDPTHPDVLDYLTEVYTTLVEYGFEYFKIDFLFAGLKSGRRYDSSQSPVEAYRVALKRIRDAVGERFILGCGAPLMPSVGLVDGMRISPDVKERWRDPVVGFLARGVGHPSAELALINCVTRAHLHKVWWLNDPDCLLVREHRSALSLEEVQTLVSILSLTGGMLFLSDDLAGLSLERRALAELALPPRGDAAKALRVRQTDRPDRFVRHYRLPGGKLEALGAVINWSDDRVARRVTPEDFELESGPYHAFELWSGAYQVVSATKPMTVSLGPHQTALLTFRPLEDRPQLVSVTHHAGQVSTVVRRETWLPEGRLEIELDTGACREGDVLVAMPPGYRERSATASRGGRLTGRTSFDGGIRYSVPIRETGTLLLTFASHPQGGE